jgi:NADPH2:quinone reductase
MVIRECGGPEVLRMAEVEKPEPGPGQARVRIEYAGVNFIDIYGRKGVYRGQLPRILGEEAAGRVDAIGPGVTEVKVGDRVVYAMQPGSYAQYATVRSWTLVRIPDAIETKKAAAIFLQGLTAHYLASSTYRLGPADTALVHAAAGGTGRLLIQVARKRGARVIGTVSTEGSTSCTIRSEGRPSREASTPCGPGARWSSLDSRAAPCLRWIRRS